MTEQRTPQGLKVIGVIPARMHSERLPGKVLRSIVGVPMLRRVFDGVRGCKRLAELLVATDSEEVYRYCASEGMSSIMTAGTHQSGTERIIEVMQTKPADVYVNIQGDEPMLTAEHIDLLIEPFFSFPGTQVSTLKTPLHAEEAENPNVVKVVTTASRQALYFSRAAIPYHRNSASDVPFYKHLGVYAYRAETLELYSRLPPSALEQTERLEQIRFLEHGIPIYVAETAVDTIGVDTEEDWQAVNRHFEALSDRR
jgi:3-deoxy-manno-octulosonate cytidylyltransferase (CMP-KDO synthetase)